MANVCSQNVVAMQYSAAKSNRKAVKEFDELGISQQLVQLIITYGFNMLSYKMSELNTQRRLLFATWAEMESGLIGLIKSERHPKWFMQDGPMPHIADAVLHFCLYS